jgi:Tol biopolymer transport system component
MKKFPNRTSRIGRFVLACTSIGFLLMSGGVTACFLYLLQTMASLVLARPSTAQSAPVVAGVRLEAGIEKEDVDGDLKSAMDIYQKIAADTSAPRDVRAKALLRLAGCDEKLGKQAKQVYEQIVHDYADQPAAAQARNRLALLRKQENPATPTTMSVHKIEWPGLGEMSPCDTDGHRAVYRAADGNLYFGDLTGQNKHLVFKVQPGDVPVWCASRDFSMTALSFEPRPNRPATLAVIKTDGTGYRELVQDDAQGTILGGVNGFNFDWSWDTRHLLVSTLPPKGGPHLMIVDLADGRHRERLRFQTGQIQDLPHSAFSPDSRYVAYSTWTSAGSSVAMHIFVIPTDGGEPQQVYQSSLRTDGVTFNETQRLHDWTADGRFLVISDVHFGKDALFLLPMKDGAAVGSPLFVRDGDIEDAHATASGALIFGDWPAHSNNFAIFHATFDPNGKLGAWKRLTIRGGDHDWGPVPSFSPDGAQIAYVSGDEEKGGKDLVLKSLATGEERVLYWFSSGAPECNYAYDLPKVYCFLGWNENSGHSDLISVATESGAEEKLASFSERRFLPIPSTDDRRIYFWAMKAFQDGQVGRWDASARKDTIIDSSSRELHQTYTPMPDERRLIRTDSRGVAMRPMPEGDWTFLVSTAAGVLSDPYDTVTYGDWVLFDAKDSEGKLRLYRILASGGELQLLGDFPASSMPEPRFDALRASRDGRQVTAVTMSESKFNLWTLENFEPSDKK